MKTITIETERLILKPFEEKDAYIAAYNSRQPSVADAMSDMVLADEKAGLEWINWINSMASVELPWQVLSIELKSENKCIGLIGIIPQPKIQGEVEILFSISDDYQGNGYATEAAQEMIKWFFSTRECKSTYLCAIVKTDNIPSQKVTEKLGFEFIENREIDYDNKPTQFKYYTIKKGA
ncbi:MAG: GNAT family N-acetyltransferase [Oscillospiraceae bacterium]|nr:GNAT family N-acetyltransferase [Oscillospiraceae bacterium]